MMSFPTPMAGPSRYPALATASEAGSASPSFSPNPEAPHSWPANGNGNGYGANGHGSGVEATGGRDAETKRNPLVDLIDSEKAYVDQLALVIRRVAAAWSRKDFPPPKLDAMFRCVEAVFRANRGFGTKLKEIGPSPSSPKALGDLLMRWIDDLEPAYSKYATTYLTGFDNFPPILANPLLPGILADISTSIPPSPPLEQWTLDALFLLPFSRLRYYRKLYARLLRSTKEGRSDHRLLLVANQRLEGLVSQIEARLEMDVADEEQDSPVSAGAKTRSAPGSVGERSREPSWAEKEREAERQSRASSGIGSSRESQSNFSPFSSRIEDRSSAGSAATSMNQSPQRRPTLTAPTPIAKSPPNTATMPLTDLELRIDPERAIDLFTMTPKRCKLQMNPSSLTYTRSLRSSHDVTIHFNPTSTGKPVVHRRAHVFVLTDLFIVAEWMEASDKAAKAQQVAREQPERVGQGGPMPEMWLCYPPLAGKHLMVAEGQQANELSVMIMRKETFVLHAESEIARDGLVKDLLDCIDFATSVSRRNTGMTPLAQDARSPSSMSDTRSHDSNFPPLRYPSPFSAASSPSTSPRPQESDMVPPGTIGGNALISQMSKISLEPGETVQWQRRPSPPITNIPSSSAGSVLPPRGASLRPRQSSTNLPASQPSMGPPQLPMGPPQLPSLPFLQHHHHSDPAVPHFPNPGPAAIPRSPSGRSIASAPRMGMDHDTPPIPTIRAQGSHLSADAAGMLGHPGPSRSRSAEPLRPTLQVNTMDPLAPPRRPNPDGLSIQSPSARFSSFPGLEGKPSDQPSPPTSPVEEDAATLTGPALISAQMKCKVFLQQAHSQWKSLGAGKLKLYKQKEGNVKQLVVESDSGKKGTILISTIVLTDGVERVAKTGVAVEVSDKGQRTGIIYMIQLRNENSAMGLFESLLVGSDRAVNRA